MQEHRQEVAALRQALQQHGKLMEGLASERDACKAAMAESADAVQA